MEQILSKHLPAEGTLDFVHSLRTCTLGRFDGRIALGGDGYSQQPVSPVLKPVELSFLCMYNWNSALIYVYVWDDDNIVFGTSGASPSSKDQTRSHYLPSQVFSGRLHTTHLQKAANMLARSNLLHITLPDNSTADI